MPQVHGDRELAGVEGLEPPASGFGDRRSSQLSYTPTLGRRLSHGRSAHGIGRSEGARKDARVALSSNYVSQLSATGLGSDPCSASTKRVPIMFLTRRAL